MMVAAPTSEGGLHRPDRNDAANEQPAAFPRKFEFERDVSRGFKNIATPPPKTGSKFRWIGTARAALDLAGQPGGDLT